MSRGAHESAGPDATAQPQQCPGDLRHGPGEGYQQPHWPPGVADRPVRADARR